MKQDLIFCVNILLMLGSGSGLGLATTMFLSNRAWRQRLFLTAAGALLLTSLLWSAHVWLNHRSVAIDERHLGAPMLLTLAGSFGVIAGSRTGKSRQKRVRSDSDK